MKNVKTLYKIYKASQFLENNYLQFKQYNFLLYYIFLKPPFIIRKLMRNEM